MKYETATILFRDGEDDFTLWVVDLPEEKVMKLKRNECAIVGKLESLLTQLPIEPGNPNHRICLLDQNGARYELYSSCASWEFFEKYSAEGTSSRGNKEAIISEVKELLEFQNHAPELAM